MPCAYGRVLWYLTRCLGNINGMFYQSAITPAISGQPPPVCAGAGELAFLSSRCVPLNRIRAKDECHFQERMVKNNFRFFITTADG